jgi:hypothetical protein
MGERCAVYVALLNEGTAAWRPVVAERLGGDLFGLAGPVPEGERSAVPCERFPVVSRRWPLLIAQTLQM